MVVGPGVVVDGATVVEALEGATVVEELDFARVVEAEEEVLVFLELPLLPV